MRTITGPQATAAVEKTADDDNQPVPNCGPADG
jgi:hypothetical protein